MTTVKSKLALLIIILFFLSLLLGLQIFFLDKVYPEIYVANINLSGLTYPESVKLLDQVLTKRVERPLEFIYLKQTFQINLRPAPLKLNYPMLLDEAFKYGRSRYYFSKVLIHLPPQIIDSLEEQTESINQAIIQPAISAQIKTQGDQINVTPSQEGLELDKDRLKKILYTFLDTGQLASAQIPTQLTSPAVSYQDALKIKKALDTIKLSPLQLVYENQKWVIDLAKSLELIDLNKVTSQTTLSLNQEALINYTQTIALAIDKEVEEPLFNFDGRKVTEFKPPIEGRKLDQKRVIELISQNIISPPQKPIELPVDHVLPKNQLTNDLGIKTLLARGHSSFTGSIPNRIFNIGLAASKINGLLITPGEIFSFNQAVGDISAAYGYKQAYIIKSGRTVLDDGGGVCQVSTTLFRSVLNAGLPVTARTAHAYRVSYYEQGYSPGLDATIFSPSVDFKFKNDTTNHILIQAYTVGTNLYVDLYGTSDGRVATLTKPVVTNEIKPLPELRQDDPTLPKGTVKQVDWPAWGANVSFQRVVTRDGETVTDEIYRSNFRPWQAVYLVGTQ